MNKNIPHIKPSTKTLFFHPDTRAVRARWVLEELELPYTLKIVNLRQGEHKKDAYLAMHPLGKVPVLEIGQTVLFETLAICLYLADHYPQYGMAPAMATIERANYYKWMAFSVGTLEPAVLEQLRLQKGQEQGLAFVDLGPALTLFSSAAHYIEETLETRPFLLGNQFTAADIMNGSVMIWAEGMGLLEEFPLTQNWLKRLKERPAYQTSIQDH